MKITQITAQQILEAVAQAKREITEDVQSGRVDRDVQDFSALHDHVDANEYGGLCAERADWPIEVCAVVQDALDSWITSGGLDA